MALANMRLRLVDYAGVSGDEKGININEELKMKKSYRNLVLIVLLILYAGVTSRALADDAYITTAFSSFTEQQYSHEDGALFKGYLNVNVTNNTNQAWGDFHFQVMSVGWDVSNVDFIAASPYAPTAARAP